MERKTAKQIAKLVNENNNLTRKLTADRILGAMHSGTALYSFMNTPENPDRVVACIKIAAVSWYQYEISHLVVDSEFRGQGFGRLMVEHALMIVEAAEGRIAQCTIVNGNTASERTFESAGFVANVSFYNPTSGNIVTVWQKSVSAVPSEEGDEND